MPPLTLTLCQKHGMVKFSGNSDVPSQGRLILTTQAWKQTSGDPSGQTWNYRGITLLYDFTAALLYMVLSVTMARIVARLRVEYLLNSKD